MTEPAPGTAVKRKRGRPRRVPIDPAAESATAAPAPTPAPAPAPVPTPQAASPDDSSSGDSGRHLNELEERINDLTESWETESLFEDILDDADETTDLSLYDPEACTLEEAARYRQELRSIGPEEFCQRTVNSGAITAKKLLTAFGVRPPSFLDGEPDESYYGLLSLALSRELSKRAKLLRYNTVDDAVHLLQTRKNIIVLTGAGISTSLGIPDFRSKDTGLYSRLAHLGLSDPQEVFDINVFRDDPTIFYSVARDIVPSTDRFTPTHAFIAMLQQRGKLLTNYSQNIDNLEAKAGIKPSKLIQCHGSFATASCVVCGYRVDGETINPTIKAGRIPRCPQCAAAKSRRASSNAAALTASRKQRKLARETTGGSNSGGSVSRSSSMDNSVNMDGAGASVPAPASRGRGRPRGRPPGKVTRPRGRPRKQHKRSDSSSDGDEDDSLHSGGVMKPDITFFGESLPDEFSRRLTEHDRDKVDLVVVIGTSLKVAPVSEVVPFMPAHIPQIYISRTPVTHINFDIDLLGDCDVVVSELCRRAGWDLTHEMIPKSQQIRVDDAVEGIPSRHLFTDVTPGKTELAPASTEALGVSKVEVAAAPEPAREGSRQASRQAREASKEALKHATRAAPVPGPEPVEIKTDFVATIREIPLAPIANRHVEDVGQAMEDAA